MSYLHNIHYTAHLILTVWGAEQVTSSCRATWETQLVWQACVGVQCAVL
jgi:hypothetical protein